MGARSICCWKSEWLFLFSQSRNANTKANPLYRMQANKARRQQLERMLLQVYFLEGSTTFNCVLLSGSARIALFAFNDINTVVEVTKERKAIPEARSFFNGKNYSLYPNSRYEIYCSSECGLVEWMSQEERYLNRFI